MPDQFRKSSMVSQCNKRLVPTKVNRQFQAGRYRLVSREGLEAYVDRLRAARLPPPAETTDEVLNRVLRSPLTPD